MTASEEILPVKNVNFGAERDFRSRPNDDISKGFAMRPIWLVSSLLVFACGVFLYSWNGDEPRIVEEQAPGNVNDSVAHESTSFDDAETDIEQSDEPPIVLAPFEAGGTLLTEPYDADWAPAAESIIDATLRSVDAYVRDVMHVACRTHSCRAVVMHDISLFSLAGPQPMDEMHARATAITTAIERAMEPVLRADPRLGEIRVHPVRVLVSASDVDLSRRDEIAGTIVRFYGAMPRAD